MPAGRQLRSSETADGMLELSLATVDVPEPGPDEVLVRVEAAPINPSDIGLLLAGAELSTASASGTPEHHPDGMLHAYADWSDDEQEIIAVSSWASREACDTWQASWEERAGVQRSLRTS